jgi:hypothetical protein
MHDESMRDYVKHGMRPNPFHLQSIPIRDQRGSAGTNNDVISLRDTRSECFA